MCGLAGAAMVAREDERQAAVSMIGESLGEGRVRRPGSARERWNHTRNDALSSKQLW
jgi:hypothetical protein